jgi:hypothetical protein
MLKLQQLQSRQKTSLFSLALLSFLNLISSLKSGDEAGMGRIYRLSEPN